MSFREAAEKGFSASVVKAFCLSGYGKVFYKRKKTFSLIDEQEKRKDRALTEEQQQALSVISKAVDAEAFKGILLKGVTGSGKTEVYLRAAERALERGGSALILVPEIALTSQMTSYFASLLGDKVVFIHSGLARASAITTASASPMARVRSSSARVRRSSCLSVI